MNERDRLAEIARDIMENELAMSDLVIADWILKARPEKKDTNNDKYFDDVKFNQAIDQWTNNLLGRGKESRNE